MALRVPGLPGTRTDTALGPFDQMLPPLASCRLSTESTGSYLHQEEHAGYRAAKAPRVRATWSDSPPLGPIPTHASLSDSSLNVCHELGAAGLPVPLGHREQSWPEPRSSESCCWELLKACVTVAYGLWESCVWKRGT